MNLKELSAIPNLLEFYGDEQYEVSSIVTHSAQASPGALFVAVPGTRTDGHTFLQDAYQAGVRAFVTQKPFRMPGVSNLVVKDTHAALAVLAARFYGKPSEHLKLIGITGTNGKTTTAFLIESILKEAGIQTGLISTVVYRWDAYCRNADRTTPDHVGLQALLRDMVDGGVEYAVMEVSSHGLHQHRVDGCSFDVALFTNLTPEHLDYHGTMEEYYRSKERLFTEVIRASKKPKTVSIINRDDPYGAALIDRLQGNIVTYGILEGDVRAANVDISITGIAADIITPQAMFSVHSRLVGRYNLSNILAAAAAAYFFGISPHAVKKGIEALRGVPGRMERIDNRHGIQVFVDYAHTADALAQVLQTLRHAGAKRIITVFGCGGDRDRAKRPAMGEVAAQHSIMVILTSDNPRSEDPLAIIREIEVGVTRKGFAKIQNHDLTAAQDRCYAVVPDRRKAIRAAVCAARSGDVVLIAGKGHETYQEAGGVRIHFDDREVAREELSCRP